MKSPLKKRRSAVIDALWTGWRAEYLSILGSTDDRESDTSASVFTRLIDSALTDQETFIIFRGKLVFAVMNVYPYAVGHLMVVPYRQTPTLISLTQAEGDELWARVTQASVVLQSEYQPHGLNIGINLGPAAGGSVSEHLHVHLVPRWRGDANFMTATANAKTISEPLEVTADRLRQAWQLLENPVTDS